MKTVIAAAVLFVLCVGVCLFFSTVTASRIDALQAITENLPKTQEQYRANKESIAESVSVLAEDWSGAVTYFSYVCGYAALNRADEAIWNLYAAIEAEDYASAIIARYQLLDALRRMRELEEISFASVL